MSSIHWMVAKEVGNVLDRLARRAFGGQSPRLIEDVEARSCEALLRKCGHQRRSGRVGSLNLDGLPSLK